MHNKELEKYIDFVLSIALNKCRNLDDARDLTQDTLISALKYLSVGKLITDYKAFLISILNRRFYDSLRKKYKLPTVCFDTLPEMAYEKDDFNSIYDTSDAEELRCQIAFLSKLYREVIVRHYMNGESVEKIANELNIPSGTVKSRLSSGRDQIKKGFNNMDTYSKQSYEPQVLYIGISGTRGLNGEPSSITDNNAIIQNLLILAYNEPITETELAKAIGIPAAYIESIIDTLVREELMKKVGNRVYTDFIIYSPDENENSILPQEKLINENFNILWNPIRTSLEKLKNLDFYKNFTEKQKSKLEYYFLMFTLAKCFFGTGSKIYDNTHIYPKRPNGGEWIASGSAYPQNFDHENTKIHKYSWSGERINCLNDILGTKEIVLRVFDTPLEKQRYYHTKYNLDDAGIAQMLYIINENIKPG
ncbi:MAG TPA: hypothetical protein DCP51_05500, partial [Clostridiales bacterium]|nr:hypothetical protein [Clostridiales bacterium]